MAAPLPDDNPPRIPFERWKNGDEAAFAPLHERLTPLLRSRLRRHRAWPLLAGHFEIDDVLQEVWSRALPAVKTTFQNNGQGSLLAFLGKIADREVIDLARRHRAQKRGEGGPAALATGFDVADAARPGRPAPTTPTSHARLSELRTVAHAVLTEREYEAWELVELMQYQAEEAALAMRTTASGVRGLLLRSRAKLVVRFADRRPNAEHPSRD